MPPDLEQVARQIDGGPFFGVYFGASVGLSREYPGGRPRLAAQRGGQGAEGGDRRRSAPRTSCSATPTADERPHGRPTRSWCRASGGSSRRTGSARPRPTAPIYIYHSALDELIPVAGPDALAAEYCREGVRLFYQRDVAGEHVAYAFTGAPAAVAYLAERFADGPVVTNCSEVRDPDPPREPGPARPAVSRLRIGPRNFRLPARKGPKVSYSSTQAGTITFTVLRRVRGGGKKAVGTIPASTARAPTASASTAG